MYKDTSHSIWQIFCFCVIVLIILSGCQGADNTAGEYIATVDGAKIYLSDFNKRFKSELDIMGDSLSLKEAEVDWLKEEILNKLIDEKIILLRAEKLSLSVGDEELNRKIEEIKKDYPDGSFDEMFAGKGMDYNIWREELRKGVTLKKLVDHDVNANITVTEDEAFAYYNDHSEEYISGERVHVVQIVVQDRKAAEGILRRLKNGEDFGKVAKEVSTGPEGVRGGDLGVFGRGVMPESFDEVVFSLTPGKISKVVKTPYGYHIFKVLKRKKGKKIGFSEVKERIVSKLRREKEEHEYVEWVRRLRSEAVIKVNRDLLREVEVVKKQAKDER
ncbi:MAG: peptidylprolyl isomerase [Proteobacteria bacterium]|nr:peptidylprolyl isomerase [Pseudomonadota bacterium]